MSRALGTETGGTLGAVMAFLGVETVGELVWIGVGLCGQALFMLRFVVQWIASERARASVMPVSFWWISIGGAGVLLAYAIHRADPVFILGQSLGFLVYGRNLWLIHAAESGSEK
ncbi:MAG: lipid-A-disaccharide synthase N-terminal domain-containing protein [Paracoccaceae bacterium]